MRNTHHMFRAISLTIGLTLLVVTGTAAMIAAFSGPASAPRAYGVNDQPVLLAPLPDVAQALSLAGDDHLLYQRVARADGTWVWELTPAPKATLAQETRSSAVLAMHPTLTLDAAGFSRVSYSLQAKPGGFSKTLKNCNNSAVTGQGAKPKTLAAYDISCNTLG
ncbi:MAG: hypothetical protein Q8M93_04255 [Polaromonas sp.]|uniref:hypothetical protein n=1 Tax=Polaromonas sp. TaxID=1869339 RepID=UPI0027318205|nr:hypothetical protein [Polaromonas sp.]MDP2450806.1 hypothetical protein [Polaromonas sp.]MDP3246158.1 hypothetical protein [Polaromonas sp.]